LLIRPLLRINHHRTRRGHLPIFFIVCVSNTGGLLTPLGDPPLFLGFLNGVPFAWTLTMWREWLLVNGLILAVFFVWDWWALRGEPPHDPGDEPRQTLRIIGSVNFLFLGGVLAVVLLQGILSDPWREIVPPLFMVALAGLSLKFTPAGLREANAFTWEPIVEVAVLFIGIFITMVPALAILKARGGELGITAPWQFFWLTGGLSAFLDNAPTYLTIANLASGEHDLGWLAVHNDPVLRAISLGAVFMGALTYIGNGPNFMVKAIANQSGVKMPSFFGYLGFACVVLLPIFALVDLLFLRG
jgi:Na+/H+ antiporter NhaD/arsenite permease-like protein